MALSAADLATIDAAVESAPPITGIHRQRIRMIFSGIQTAVEPASNSFPEILQASGKGA